MLDLYQLNYLQQLSLKEKRDVAPPTPPQPAMHMQQFNFISSQMSYNDLCRQYENTQKRKSELLKEYNLKLTQNAALNNVPSSQIQGLIDEINAVNKKLRELDMQLSQY